jgi:hypothetical protein
LYEEDSSSIGFRRSVVYGFGVLGTAGRFWLARRGLARPRIFAAEGRRLAPHALLGAAAGSPAPVEGG